MSSLTVEKSLLYPDIQDIIKNPEEKYVASFIMEMKLHTEEKDLDRRDGVILNSINIIRDYTENISDYIEIQLSMHLGTYVYDVYKQLHNIEVTLITYRQMYQGKKPFISKERYKAVYLIEKNTAIPTVINQSKDDLNQNLPITITLQLVDRSVETIRVKTTQGNFDKKINPKNTDMSPKAFMKSIFSEECDKILIENKPAIDLISIEEPDNKDELKAITLSSYTRIIEIPEYLQNENIGVYNAGIGCYIQKFGLDHYTYKKILFIYSLFDPKKYDDAEYKMIFYVPVASNLSMLDNTYKYKDKTLKMLPYTMSKINDQKETNVMSTGSGFRSSNAASYMKKPVEITEEGPVFNRNRLNTEVIYKDRKDNLNYAPNRAVVGNQFAMVSQIVEKVGNYVTLEVSNIDHDFIYPGACKINYEDDENKIKEVKGVVHRAIITYRASSMNLPMDYNSDITAFTSHATLQVFIMQKEDYPTTS
jgi:hypothetical protein